MTNQEENIQNFWSWFKANERQLRSLNDPGDPFWDFALEQLKKIHLGLWFEMSQPEQVCREFVITVEGDKNLFSLADQVIAAAPAIPRWQFISLKPACGFDFTTTYEDVFLDPKQMWFLPLESSARPHELGLRIAVPQLDSGKIREVSNGILTILDTALGERNAAENIHYMEVCDLPESPESKGFIKLPELPNHINWLKSQRSG